MIVPDWAVITYTLGAAAFGFVLGFLAAVLGIHGSGEKV